MTFRYNSERCWGFAKKLVFALILLCMFATPSAAAPEDEDWEKWKEVVRKADELTRGVKSYSECEMSITTPRWERTIGLNAWTEGTQKALIIITSPAKEKGVSTLKIGREMWSYVPRIDRIIKIPPSMMLQSWMGSDFTNEDLAKADSIVSEYTHSLARTEREEGEEVWIIQCDPKPDAAVVWGKVVIAVRKRGYLPLWEELYNEQGDLIKRLVFSNVRTVSGREVPATMTMRNLKKEGHQTVIDCAVLDFDPQFDPAIFSLQFLKRSGR